MCPPWICTTLRLEITRPAIQLHSERSLYVFWPYANCPSSPSRREWYQLRLGRKKRHHNPSQRPLTGTVPSLATGDLDGRFVYFCTTVDGRPTGSAFVRFDTEEHATEAEQRFHERTIHKQWIELLCIAWSEMYQQLRPVYDLRATYRNIRQSHQACKARARTHKSKSTGGRCGSAGESGNLGTPSARCQTGNTNPGLREPGDGKRRIALLQQPGQQPHTSSGIESKRHDIPGQQAAAWPKPATASGQPSNFTSGVTRPLADPKLSSMTPVGTGDNTWDWRQHLGSNSAASEGVSCKWGQPTGYIRRLFQAIGGL